MQGKQHFNVRVYGLWVNEKTEVLITDEYMSGKYLSKFPGGGLEFGEGVADCLRREWQEELNIDITIKQHFYTTDFFQVSVFNPDAQIISVYYLVEPLSQPEVNLKSKAFDFAKIEDGAQSFRTIALAELNESDMTLPIDKKVSVLLKQYYNI